MTYLELARRQRGWSQADLGEHQRVRISRSFISYVENKTGIPTPDQLQRLSDVLGVRPPERLLEDVPEATAVVGPLALEQKAG